MRRALIAGLSLAIFLGFMLTLTACGDGNVQKTQREESVDLRAEGFARAETLIPVPRNENFPLRVVLAEYTVRQDLINHPWYTYILNDLGAVTHYFVSTAVPVNSCAFLGSTEDVLDQGTGSGIILTAPSLDGIYYGGSGAASACNGWIFIDAATGVLGMAFGMKIMTFDAPLILETEPTLIQPTAVE